MASCPTCSEQFESLGTHFRYHDHRKPVTDKQHEIISGLLMGDGTIYGRRDDRGDNAFLSVTMSNENFIDFLVDEFGWLSRNKHSSYTDGKEYYVFQTRSHPDLNKYKSWYQPNKIWPEIEITPTMLKYLYISDGTYDTNNSHKRIMIACAKEGTNSDKIERMFKDSGYPISHTYHYERKGRADDYQIWFDVNATEKIFESIGDPLPGFEYKWPESK